MRKADDQWFGADKGELIYLYMKRRNKLARLYDICRSFYNSHSFNNGRLFRRTERWRGKRRWGIGVLSSYFLLCS